MKLWITAGFAALAVLASATAIFADHQWSKYHYERPSKSELVLNISDCHRSSPHNNWSNMLRSVVADWDKIPDDGKTYDSPYIGFNYKSNCKDGNTKSYNDDYGDTGWLGLARIWIYVGKDGNRQGRVPR